MARAPRFGPVAALLACALAACAAPAPQPGDDSRTSVDGNPNLPFPTLGGKQLWADLHWYAGWRVQQHVWTGHCRLLDEHDVRRAWGSREACEAALNRARDERGLRLPSREIAVLVHGLGRSRASMAPMQTALEAAGWAVVDLGYPSTRRSLEEHAAQLNTVLDHLAADGAERVDFVTHSLGGLVVRRALAEERPWKEELALGRIAMLAPPSRGSAMAQGLKDFLPFRWVAGEVGQELTLDEARAVPPPSGRFGVVAAQRGDGGGWNPILAGADDGVVRVDETRLDGMEDFLLVNGLHSFVMGNRHVVAAVPRYLRTGSFGADEVPADPAAPLPPDEAATDPTPRADAAPSGD